MKARRQSQPTPSRQTIHNNAVARDRVNDQLFDHAYTFPNQRRGAAARPF